MKKFVIFTDSCSELTEEARRTYDVEYLPMYVSYGDRSIKADLDWKEVSAKEFYDVMRSGTRILTSQVPAGDYVEKFEACLKEGYDILSISCSSALSASVKASEVAKKELLEKYPSAKIYCIDSLISSAGLGILCIYASKLRSQGKTIDEVAKEVELFKMKLNQFGTVDDLKFLKACGRISGSKAFFGTLLGVKPVIVSNHKGENVSSEKAKGRVNSIRRLADLTVETYVGEKIEEIYISHGDCLEDAEKLKAFILEKKPDAKIFIGILNPIVGASCGPNTLISYCVGSSKPTVTD